eukprot:187293_1
MSLLCVGFLYLYGHARRSSSFYHPMSTSMTTVNHFVPCDCHYFVPFHSNAPKSGYKSPSQSHELSITSFVCTTSSSSSSISSLSDVFFLFTFCSFAPFMDKYKLHV